MAGHPEAGSPQGLFQQQVSWFYKTSEGVWGSAHVVVLRVQISPKVLHAQPFRTLCLLPSLHIQKVVPWWAGAQPLMFHPEWKRVSQCPGCSLHRPETPWSPLSLGLLVTLLFSLSTGRAELKSHKPRRGTQVEMSQPRAEGQCSSAGNRRPEPEFWPWLQTVSVQFLPLQSVERICTSQI